MPTPDEPHLRLRIRAVRKRAGIGLKPLAKAAGIAFDHLSRVERDQRPGVQAQYLVRLAIELAPERTRKSVLDTLGDMLDLTEFGIRR